MTLNKKVLELNKDIKNIGLVCLTWGNVSCISEDGKTIIIKPSGIDLDKARPEDMSIIDINTGNKLGGKKSSVDTLIHLELYRNFKDIKTVVHTHSKFATILSQANMSINCTGTTHADYFDGTIPIVKELTEDQIKTDYEQNLGISIIEYFNENNLDYRRIKAALLPYHGPIAWGMSYSKGVENAFVLEKISEMFYYQLLLSDKFNFNSVLLRKHFDRKHGSKKYYGQ
jgi:L-ribulose-5-phosphate 4-epimerase